MLLCIGYCTVLFTHTSWNTEPRSALSTLKASLPLEGGSISGEAVADAWASIALLFCDVQLALQLPAAWLA